MAKRKSLSLIIVPHSEAKFKTIALSRKALKILAGVVGLGIVAMVAFLVDYFTMNVTRADYKNLLQENSQQKELLANYKETIQELETTVDDFRKYASKLNVMAGLRSSEVLKELGVGGGDSSESGDADLSASSSPPQTFSFQDPQSVAQKAEDVGKNLDLLLDFFETQAAKLATTPTIWPTVGWMSSPFGWRNDPFTGKRTFHYGIDIATNYGNPIVATADGIILALKNDKIGGKNITISHGGGVTTHYCHLSKFLVKAGQKIKRGDVIGLIGRTGKALGPHLHYEVRINNKSVNPYKYILEE